jgi:hypothetical protein
MFSIVNRHAMLCGGQMGQVIHGNYKNKSLNPRMMNQVIWGFIFHIRKKNLPHLPPEASQKDIHIHGQAPGEELRSRSPFSVARIPRIITDLF